MLEILGVLIVVAIIWLIIKNMNSISNETVKFDDNRFKRAGVEVLFKERKITIKNMHSYSVDQITGIKSEPVPRLKFIRAIIEVDDFKKPRHYIEFSSQKRVDEFTQRLSVALRKAGGPSFI